MTPTPELPIAPERLRTLASGAPGSAGVRLERLGVPGLLTIRADPAGAALAGAFREVVGLELPERLRFVADGDRLLRWMSPDEWLLSCPFDEVAAIERGLGEALGGERGNRPGAAVVEVSGAFCRFVLAGQAVRETLARAVPIDLDPRAFGPGRVAGTVFAKVGATLANLGDDRIELLCRRSQADYVVRFVANAAREHGFAPLD